VRSKLQVRSPQEFILAELDRDPGENMSPSKQLIQVVPQLTPMRCGVTDHAIPLARELEAAFEIDTAFVVLNSREKCDLAYPIIHCAPQELLQACLSLSNGRPGSILVHLSGYGYSRDGAPTLLADALTKVRKDGRFRVAVYFHELFATGMPWRSAFWYSRRQRNAVRRIAEECDLRVTSTRCYADWLERKSDRERGYSVQVLPVFSTVGEARELLPIVQRQQTMAVFGLSATRRTAYKELKSARNLLRDLGIREIADLGPESEVPLEVHGVPVRRRGVLAPADLVRELAQATFGFLSYAPALAAKSGVFAAYCAHGTVPVITKAFNGEADGLRDGRELLSPGTVKTALASGLEHCSKAAWLWYCSHRLNAHAATYARWLSNSDALAPAVTRGKAEIERT